jgi:hypothetical protein
MPYETYLVDDGKGVYKIGHGVVTGADILASSLRRSIQVQNSGENPVKYALIDFSRTTEFHVSRDTVSQVLEIDRRVARYSVGCFVAAVAPDCLIFGMARIWSSFTKDIGWESQVFRDLESAKQWLRTRLGDGNPDNCPYDQYPTLRPGNDVPPGP